MVEASFQSDDIRLTGPVLLRFGMARGDQVDTVVRREAGEEKMVRIHLDKGVASHIGPEPCARVREGTDEATTAGRTILEKLKCERLSDHPFAIAQKNIMKLKSEACFRSL